MKNIGMLVCLLTIFMAGCSYPSEHDSGEGLPVLITLTCNPNLNSEPCQNVQFDRPDEIRMMMETIHTAERLLGIIDYGAEYRMSITNTNGSITGYDLSLGMDSKMQGLLVNHEDTNIGYSISVEDANQLRRLIQRRTD
ncbi:hypothetical protein C0Q44_14585 [Paenibacillus sp. PCH8]|uniref:hypothetical protein n=1 Tax=Paenibacillus sp. PCH8 TaxID=2066524 RepID=UPI000CFA5ACE|nr:hypothetical protein [Paenibacillus sp. PCH8]PQP82641.1 hypothetical protein C0Q44_14585 [Paenibacillus sp. PCH8]